MLAKRFRASSLRALHKLVHAFSLLGDWRETELAFTARREGRPHPTALNSRHSPTCSEEKGGWKEGGARSTSARVEGSLCIVHRADSLILSCARTLAERPSKRPPDHPTEFTPLAQPRCALPRRGRSREQGRPRAAGFRVIRGSRDKAGREKDKHRAHATSSRHQ